MGNHYELKPAAFWSYAHFDDIVSSGRLSALCDALSKEVQVQTGVPFPIFRDRNDIEWGQNWKHRIQESLGQVTFFLPVITPSYLNSENCKKELESFLEREKNLNRNDLVMPIIYVEAPELEATYSSIDPLIQGIVDHQWVDWRDLRHEPFQSPKVERAIESLAQGIVNAIKRIVDFQKLSSQKSDVFQGFTSAKMSQEMREALDYRQDNRLALTELMAQYYVRKYPELALVPQGTSILSHKDYLPDQPQELQFLDKNMSWIEENPFKLSANSWDFVSILKSLPETGRIYNGFNYRLMEMDGKNFKFCSGRYYDYLNSCEYLGFELALSITKNPILKSKLSQTGMDCIHEAADILLANPAYLPSRNGSELFDFGARSTAFGTATLTIIKRSKKSAQFVMNRRSRKLSETPGLLHVIPAGTFQSNFPTDRFHTQEFSFTENIVREFIEELIDDRQLRGNPQLVFNRNDMFSETGLAFRKTVYESQNMDLIYLGTVIDPINLKPEILTVFMVHEAYLRLICGEILNPSWETEGEGIELYDFSEKSMSSLLSDNLLVPTGKAHLLLALKHFDYLKNRLATI